MLREVGGVLRSAYCVSRQGGGGLASGGMSLLFGGWNAASCPSDPDGVVRATRGATTEDEPIDYAQGRNDDEDEDDSDPQYQTPFPRKRRRT